MVNRYSKGFAAGRVVKHRIDVVQSTQSGSPRDVMSLHAEVFEQFKSSRIGHFARSSQFKTIIDQLGSAHTRYLAVIRA